MECAAGCAECPIFLYRRSSRLTGYVQQRDPDILHQVLGPNGPLGSTGAKLAVAGLAALAAKHFLSGSGGFGSSGGSLL
ncbi:MAG TPA: hypothetical protein VKY19_05610 [Ktedonosporobacter sp.]|nr:hypothetical protein [Ktedonosporobacter sp.]